METIKIKSKNTVVVLDASEIPSNIENVVKKAFGKVERVSKGEDKYFAWVTTTDVKKEALATLLKEKSFISIAPESRNKVVVLFKA